MAYKKKEFKYSDDTEAYRKAVDDFGVAPKFNSEYTGLSKAALDDYLNRGKFSYDVNADALYNQYADKYTKQGQLAMKDTMGQAASLTGGYGNSYAQSVGQQAYQGYMQQLADKVPELQQIAYGRWQDQGQEMLNKYSLYADREAQGYSHNRDAVSDYYTRLGIAREDLANSEAKDWEKYTFDENLAYTLANDEYNRAWNEEERAYNRNQNAISNAASANKQNLDLAMSVYELTGDPTQVNKLTGMNYPVIDVASGNSTTKALGYKDYASLLENVENYLQYDENGNISDGTKAAKYLSQLINNGSVSEDDARTIASQAGIGSELKKIETGTDTRGWSDDDFAEFFSAIYNTDGKDAAIAEIYDYQDLGVISKELANRLVQGVKDLAFSQYRKEVQG